MSRRPSARDVALRVFRDWDESGESADVLIDRHFAKAGLGVKDRALAGELVRGVFRWRGRLDWQLAHLVDRPLAELDPVVLWILRLGLYQLEHLDRVPAHAAVNTSVELTKRAHHGAGSSLVNAVLRRAPERLADLVEPDAAEDPLGHLEVRTSHPRWLLERWLDRLGFRKTLRLAAANQVKPSLTLRVASDRVGPDDLLGDLGRLGIDAEPGLVLPDTVRVPGGWDPRLLEILENGLAVVQDEAAGIVAHVARPAAGATILDVCAAPGGKSLHLAELCGEATVVAADVSVRRLARMRSTVERTGRTGVHLIAADGRAPATTGGFSRVLVDAPCTNTGVLGRRPDARWRRTAEDLPRLAKLQGELLDAAREQVGPGGLLIYSTCSLEPEENEDVIASYLERHRGDSLLPSGDVLPPELVSGEFLRTDPGALPLDGSFAAAIQPRGNTFRVIS